MSNDEQARRYVEAETPAEPAFTARLMPEEMPRQRGALAEPLQPFQQETPVEPLQPAYVMARPVEQGEVEATAPLQPAYVMGRPVEQGELVEPVQPAYVMARPVEQGEVEATAPLQPAHVMARPVEQGVPTAASRTLAAKRRGETGGAGTGFQADPEQYRAAVSPMLAAYEQVADLSRSLSAFMSSMEAQNPWGNDESGKKFAEGEKGYLQYSHDTMAVLKGLPDELKYIADGLKAMAANYENADEDVTAELGGIESTVQMPTAPSLPSTPVQPIISTRPVQSGRH
ncbi:hypothetical protein ACFC6L_05305 [Kitasatospora phosalacinea]|uniref:hypothetical protein n=1 Tax=Kitasatospora phosalacinea TaxID=2065 RepID=UPI0035D97635